MVTKKKLLEARKLTTKGMGLSNIILLDAQGNISNYIDKVCLQYIMRHRERFVFFIDWPFAYIFGDKDKNYPYHFISNKQKLRAGFSEKQTIYLQWLTQESAWQHAFLTKDTSEVLKLGMMFNVDLPAPYVIQANILLRYMSEQPQVIEHWNKLSAWVDPHIALWFSHHIGIEDKNTFILQFNAGIYNTNHSLFADSNSTWQYRSILKNIIAKKPVFTTSLPMKDGLTRNFLGSRYL